MTQILVASGSVSLANMRLSAVNGAAFVDFSLAKVLGPYIGCHLYVYDHLSAAIDGYIKAAGTGETYGAELVTNGGFSTVAITYNTLIGAFAAGDTVSGVTSGATGTYSADAGGVLTLTGVAGTFAAAEAIAGAPSGATAVVVSQSVKNWSASNALLPSVTGGETGNALQIRNVGANNGISYQSVITTVGKLYKVTVYAKTGTSGALQVYVGTAPAGSQYYDSGSVTPAGWTAYSVNLTATTTTTFITLKNVSAVADEYAYYDSVSLTQVLTPSATGVTIVSAQNGTVQNWTNNAGIDSNDALGFTYAIYATDTGIDRIMKNRRRL